jgi:23S rRNA pseudouridine2457 synthase
VTRLYKYFRIYKPYGMLSQFTDKSDRPTLKDLFSFPPDVYPVGRLDYDSEGLLILTNNPSLNNFLLNPTSKTEKEYLAQVEGKPLDKDLEPLRGGIIIEGKRTLPAELEIIEDPGFPSRNPPVRFRKTVPDTWIKIIIRDGRNRQVRKMTAKIGFPTLRLIRIRIKNITLEGLAPGEVKELNAEELKNLIT